MALQGERLYTGLLPQDTPVNLASDMQIKVQPVSCTDTNFLFHSQNCMEKWTNFFKKKFSGRVISVCV